ncbi:MAG TPA: DUF2231 domain-containing protein [Actinomycetota bacterium]|nr:DUF2231 domain-containing protein [Actinomycetota bacterium]
MPRLFSIKPTLVIRGRKFKGIRGWAGKPFHPPLTDFPIVAYFLAGTFDLISYIAFKRNPEGTVARDFFIAATHVIIAGGVVSTLTIVTGFWDWLKSAPKRTQAWRTANWHMAIMLTTTILAAADILLRLAYWSTGYEQGADLTLLILSLIVAGLVSFGSAYGGTMVYEYGFNVEQDFDHAYTESEVDKLYHQEIPPSDQGDD